MTASLLTLVGVESNARQEHERLWKALEKKEPL